MPTSTSYQSLNYLKAFLICLPMVILFAGKSAFSLKALFDMMEISDPRIVYPVVVMGIVSVAYMMGATRGVNLVKHFQSQAKNQIAESLQKQSRDQEAQRLLASPITSIQSGDLTDNVSVLVLPRPKRSWPSRVLTYLRQNPSRALIGSFTLVSSAVYFPFGAYLGYSTMLGLVGVTDPKIIFPVAMLAAASCVATFASMGLGMAITKTQKTAIQIWNTVTRQGTPADRISFNIFLKSIPIAVLSTTAYWCWINFSMKNAIEIMPETSHLSDSNRDIASALVGSSMSMVNFLTKQPIQYFKDPAYQLAENEKLSKKAEFAYLGHRAMEFIYIVLYAAATLPPSMSVLGEESFDKSKWYSIAAASGVTLSYTFMEYLFTVVFSNKLFLDAFKQIKDETDQDTATVRAKARLAENYGAIGTRSSIN